MRKATHARTLEAMLFDIGDTLLPASEIASRALAETAQWFVRVGLSTNEETFLSGYNEADASARGPAVNHLFSDLTIAQHALEAAGIADPVANGAQLLAVYRTAVRQRIRLNADLVGFFEKLKKARYKTAAVTDGTTIEQVETLYRLGILPFFDSVVTSESVGHEKPHPAVFNAALASIAARPEKSLMVGDNIGRDILGAAALGLKTALVLGQSSEGGSHACDAADYTIRSVTDLDALFCPV